MLGTQARRHVSTKGGMHGGSTRVAVLTLVLLAGIAAHTGFAGEPPSADDRFVVIQAGTIITNAGAEIHNGVIVLSGGKIQNVGRGLEYPRNAKIIDARNRVVMPGLIDPHSRFGLPNYSRTEVHGNWSVADEYFPSPHEYDELLDAGYTALALVPAGGGIPGRAIVVRTGGVEGQRILQSPSYLRVTPEKRVFRAALERAKQEIEKVDKARQEFEKKAAEQKPATQASQPTTQSASAPTTQPAFQPPPIDPAYQVLVDLIQKQAGVFALLELNGASDFVQMSDVLKKFDIAHHYLARNVAQSDFAYVAAKLGEQKAKIILQPVINRAPFSAERLHLVRMFAQAGCEVSLMPFNDSAREHERILGRVANLVREGWARSEALKAVTLYPARLLGLDARLGSIEKGKDADLIFLDADPLDPQARVCEVMIAGEVIHRVKLADADARQTEAPQ
jgi:hypothetical protein